jgi:hypothetical protein
VSLYFLNSAPPSNDPSTAVEAGNGFLMRQGYTVLSVAWDPTVEAGDDRLLAKVPVATNADGSSIVGRRSRRSRSTTARTRPPRSRMRRRRPTRHRRR